MKEYHKIQTVFFRSPETNFRELMEGVWSTPEFELLKDINWIWTEKIDGTNIRIMWDGVAVRFGGKTDNAQIPAYLLNVLQDLFTEEKMSTIFGKVNLETDEKINVCLYGEGYGAKIQKGGGNYIPDGVSFILFDIKIGEWWLQRDNIETIAQELEISVVPIIGQGTLLEAVQYVKTGYTSAISNNKQYIAEGLIMKPEVDLFNRK